MSAWERGAWLHPPVASVQQGDRLLVTAARGSDFWQETSYGFRRDGGHALLAPLPPPSSVEVTFLADYGDTFDQAGLLVRLDERSWVKAGVEVSDGVPQLSAVVTRDRSDWSTSPVPAWAGRDVTVRASWADGALTVRARVEDEPWRLVRLAPFPASSEVRAGPYCCAPEREGLTVTFLAWRSGPADTALHG